MTEQSNLYVWQTGPGQWMARHIISGQAAVGQTREEALQLFTTVWAERSPFTVVDGAPPLPRRDDGPRESEPAIDADERHRRGYGKFREMLKQHHPDTNPKRKFTADEVTRALVELWEAVR